MTDAAVTTRTETVTGPDGSFTAHLAVPGAGSANGAGVVLVHEIFGVNEYVRSAAARYAALGYVVLCPDLYWRVAPGTAIDTYDDESVGRAFGLVQQIDTDQASADVAAATAHLRALPEVTGAVALAGFCFGGWLAYAAAPGAEPAAVVSYYGPPVVDNLDILDRIGCPVLFHIGGADPFFPAEKIEALQVAASSRDDVRVELEPLAGHAFDNPNAGGEHDAEAAQRAWATTTAFLRKHLAGA